MEIVPQHGHISPRPTVRSQGAPLPEVRITIEEDRPDTRPPVKHNSAGTTMLPAIKPAAPASPASVLRGHLAYYCRTPQGWADVLWYVGHVMGAGSLLSRYSLPAAAVMVGGGQLLVIVSRPLGRMQLRPKPSAADDSV